MAFKLAHIGRADHSAYCALKAAVIGLTRSWMREFAPDILTSAVAPGPVDTPVLSESISPVVVALGERSAARVHRSARGDRQRDRISRGAGGGLRHGADVRAERRGGHDAT